MATGVPSARQQAAPVSVPSALERDSVHAAGDALHASDIVAARRQRVRDTVR